MDGAKDDGGAGKGDSGSGRLEDASNGFQPDVRSIGDAGALLTDGAGESTGEPADGAALADASTAAGGNTGAGPVGSSDASAPSSAKRNGGSCSMAAPNTDSWSAPMAVLAGLAALLGRKSKRKISKDTHQCRG
jgi:hypothetical protein